MRNIKYLSVFLLLLTMLLLSGCWNYRELDNLSMVAGFAVDKGTGGHKYHLTIEFLDLTKNQPGSKILETEGDTIFDGIRNAVSESQKKLFFSDCKVIIVSQDIAKDGMASVFDWVTRDAEPRITINPIVSKAATAAELLRQKPITDQMISMEIWRTLDQNTIALSQEPNVKLYQANNMLASDGTSLILPAAKIEKSQDGTNFELDGSAVFKKDKLIGFLDRYDTKYLLFIKNQIKGGLLLTSPASDGSSVALEIFESKTSVTPEITGKDVSMKINIDMKASLGEDNTTKNYVSAQGIQKVEQSAETTLVDGVSSIIKKVQSQFGSDVFGFGSIIYRNSPEFWGKEKGNWEHSFQTVKSTVTAHVSIENAATANMNIKAG